MKTTDSRSEQIYLTSLTSINVYTIVTSTTAIAVNSHHIQLKQACRLENRARHQFLQLSENTRAHEKKSE